MKPLVRQVKENPILSQSQIEDIFSTVTGELSNHFLSIPLIGNFRGDRDKRQNSL